MEQSRLDAAESEAVDGDRFRLRASAPIEATNQIKDLKIDIIDRISSAKIQTILWVVGVGVLQLVAHYFLK